MKCVPIIQPIILAGLFAVGAAVSAQPGMGKYQQLYTTGSEKQ